MNIPLRGGFFFVSRLITNSSLWTMPPYCRVLAMTCLCLANWEAKKWFDGKAEVLIPRGSFVTSLSHLSEHARLSHSLIIKALKHLSATGFIKRRSTANWTLIEVVNYNVYQNPQNYINAEFSDPSRPQSRPEAGPEAVPEAVPEAGPEAGPNRRSKEVKNIRSKETTGATTAVDDDGFDSFWLNYPRKVSKPTALRSWKRIFLKPNPELFKTILAALDRHKQLEQWTRDDGQYIPHPTTWLNQRRWEDTIHVPTGGNGTKPAVSEDSAAHFARLAAEPGMPTEDVDPLTATREVLGEQLLKGLNDGRPKP